MPKIYLYAEVLIHLRQLTLHASLETEKNEQTKIDVSSDKKIITVIHDGESSSLYLPTQISGTAQVTFPYDRKTEISARVEIEDLEQWKEMNAAGIEAPWNASELTFETSMKCNQCESDIVPLGTISSWKDLPNSNWADVMDLWFCHKPHEHNDEDQEAKAAGSKGFSAQSKLVSEPGTGLVDLVSFALHPDDCNILKTIATENTNSNMFRPIPVSCPECRTHIGTFSNSDNLVRLDKSSLSVRTEQKSSFHTYPPSCFVSAQLLELIESSAIRKVVAYTQPAEAIPEKVVPAAAAEEDETKNALSRPKDTADIGQTPQQDAEAKTGVAYDIPNRSKVSATPSEPDSETHVSSTTSNNLNQKASKDHPEEKAQTVPQPLLLWVFNPDIYYSSSRLTTSVNDQNTDSTTPTTTDIQPTINSPSPTPQQPTPGSSTPPPTNHNPPPQDNSQASSQAKLNTTSLLPHRALKIFYQRLPHESLQSHLPSSTPLNNSPNSYEPLPLSPQTLTALHQTLESSTSMLPATARTFPPTPPSTTTDQTQQQQQQATVWSVGLLDRYERHPTAEKVMEANPLARKLAGDDIAEDGRPRVTRWEMPAGAAELYL